MSHPDPPPEPGAASGAPAGWVPPPPGWAPPPPGPVPRPPEVLRPTRRSRGPRLLLAASMAVNVILIAIVATGTNFGHDEADANVASRTAAGQRSGGPGSPTMQATGSSAPHRVLATFAGTGPDKTATFRIGGDGTWLLRWSYNCASFYGGTGNFIVAEDNGGDLDGADVNELGRIGRGATHVYGDLGIHYLSIDSECRWRVKVIGAP